MTDWIVALGLVLVIEGVGYALFATQLRSLAARLATTPESMLRISGAVAVAVGVLVVFLARG